MKYLELGYGILAANKSLKTCPNCKRRSFIQWNALERAYNPNGIAFPKYVGECLYETCGYNSEIQDYISTLPKGISFEWVDISVNRSLPNKFEEWLQQRFNLAEINIAFNNYYVGTSTTKCFQCFAPTLWQIDKSMKVISGRIPIYGDKVNYIAIKDKKRMDYKSNEHYYLFGEHLIGKHPDKPINVNSRHVDPPFLRVDPPAQQAINVRAK